MILPDVNLLLYAHDSSSSRHVEAKRWLEEGVQGNAFVLLTWSVILGFLRISTSLNILAAPLNVEQAIAHIRRLLEHPNVKLIHSGERHWGILCELLNSGQCRGPLVPDAHLAALAIEHGATLYSTDRDFSRFPGLRFENPLG